MSDQWPALRDFTIKRTDFPYNGHSEIAINNPADPGDPERRDVPFPVMAGHAMWAAGVLARITVAAMRELEKEKPHDCPLESLSDGDLRNACDVYTHLISASWVPTTTDDGPGFVSITVPTPSAAKWVDRVSGWLTAVTA